eukprot:GHVQ01012768.1.p1 GENE.GHVQ01012768.1~~GHVQ01012768.1.p1  ORF type:complete len:147 (+),score=13.93 GHVQ01012768.1:245-685(+)
MDRHRVSVTRSRSQLTADCPSSSAAWLSQRQQDDEREKQRTAQAADKTRKIKAADIGIRGQALVDEKHLLFATWHPSVRDLLQELRYRERNLSWLQEFSMVDRAEYYNQSPLRLVSKLQAECEHRDMAFKGPMREYVLTGQVSTSL